MTMTNEPTPAPAEELNPPAAVETKPRTPFTAAAKVVLCTNLAAVHFAGFSAQALEPADAIPEDVVFEASTRFLHPTVTPTDDGFLTKTTLVFQVRGRRPDSESSSTPYATIRATLEARYLLKPGSAEFGEDDLKDYALCYCPFHVWGYWREFVQSSLARLDLPQFTIPLYLIHQAPQMVRDRVD